MSSDSSFYKEIISKLEKLIRKEYLHLFITGLQVAVLAALANFTFYSFLEMIANFNSAVRTVLFFLFVIIVVAAIVHFVLFPALKYFNIIKRDSYLEAADKVGRNFPSIKDDLLNSMQLVNEVKSESLYSLNLIDAAFRNIYNKVKEINFDSIVKFERAKKLLPYFIGLIVLSSALFIFIPGMNAASFRLINFDKEFTPPPKFFFEISPGNKEITKGENVEIAVKVIGQAPKEIYIATRKEEETDFQKLRLIPDSSGVYSLKLSSVKSAFKYFAEAENIKSEWYEIKVIDRPVIKTLELMINPPSYSRMPQAVQVDNGNVNGLIGTKVKVNLSSTKDLKQAYLEFDDSSSIKLAIDGENASGNFIIKKDGNYRIKILDVNENDNSSPITYEIKALYDAFPVIELIKPNQNIPLANDNRVNLIAKASDDFGFSKLVLNYKLSSSKYKNTQDEFSSIEIPFGKSLKEIDINYIWNLTSLTLAVDDVVTYYLEIFDNDFVSGPKSAKTSSFTVRVPSLEEVLKNADETQVQTESELEETYKEAEDLKKTLEKIDQELKKDDEKLTWEEKEKVEDALEKFQELQDKVDKMNDQLSEMRQNLQENNLLSKETMEKYLELQKLMDELTSGEMKKAMEQLQNMLKEMNRDMTQDALEKFKLDEERFKKSIERTLNLLKRIQIEQKIDELVKRTEELIKNQEELKEQTEQSDLSDQKEKNDLSQKQNEITDVLNKLNEEMKGLEEKMSEIKDMPTEEMQKMTDEFEKQQNQRKSENASENIQQNQKQMAMQNQQQLSSNMNQMKEMMQQMQQSMQQQNQMQTFTDMMKILDNLISLSKKQEELKKDSENSDPNSSSLNDLAEKQNNLSNNLQGLLQQMSELSQKTFAVSPEMGKALGDAKKQMESAIQSMQNRNGSFAALQQAEAMKHLNEAAMMMKSSMEAMMQGGSGGGMMSLMQQLQQLSGQQMNLNNLTQMLQKMQQGGLSPHQQNELLRLSQQQEMIQKSMEQLNKEAKISGESTKLPADLDNIVKQMHEVVKDMDSQKLDDELVQKQENILSRMLDAQRSINERDFEKERESRTGETVYRVSPGELNLSNENQLNKIKDEINKAVKEGYSRDYEELIRKYYDVLEKEGINTSGKNQNN